MTPTVAAPRPSLPPRPSAAIDGAQAGLELAREPASSLNVQQRILAITAEVAVKATGKTAQGQRTMSIADVEEALADLCAKHGVVIGDYFFNEPPQVAAQQGNNTLWMVNISMVYTNADDPQDKHLRQLFDVGTSPSAAVSFALKRFYRALFHLADEEDEKRSTPAAKLPASTQRSAPTSQVGGAGKQGSSRDNPAAPSLAIRLSDNEKAILKTLADTLDQPWSAERRSFELGRLGNFLLVRDLLLGLHREQHKDCEHLAEAILAGSEEERSA